MRPLLLILLLAASTAAPAWADTWACEQAMRHLEIEQSTHLNRDPSAIVAAAARAERECGFDDLVPNLPESQPRPARRAPQNVDPCYAVPGGMQCADGFHLLQ